MITEYVDVFLALSFILPHPINVCLVAPFTFRWRTKSILYLQSGLMSFRIRAVIISMPFDSWVTMQLCGLIYGVIQMACNSLLPQNPHSRWSEITENTNVLFSILSKKSKPVHSLPGQLISFIKNQCILSTNRITVPGSHGRVLGNILSVSPKSE